MRDLKTIIGYMEHDVNDRQNSLHTVTITVEDAQVVLAALNARPEERKQLNQGETMHDIARIARIAHEVNRAYCLALGDTSQAAWEDAPQWQKDSAINGVNFHLDNPSAGPDHSHNAWWGEKVAAGWKYGPVKDADKKEHPCCVPYDQLPVEQRAKDYLFRGVVHAFVGG